MKFEYIPKRDASKSFGYIEDSEAFYRFIDDFNIIGVCWSQPTSISPSYFLRLLQNGSSEKARGYHRKHYIEDDEHSMQLQEFYLSLFDHGALWKDNKGGVICTAMPYGDEDTVLESFNKLTEQFNFPNSIILQVLDSRYRFRSNGDLMIAIYCDMTGDIFNPDCSEEELLARAIQHATLKPVHYCAETSSFVRNQYVSEYVKRRAHGVCQLCNHPAPFFDEKGKPYLEAHHIVWLADGGSDSIDNCVALCPNCHRKMHILDLEEDVIKLQEIVRKT